MEPIELPIIGQVWALHVHTDDGQLVVPVTDVCRTLDAVVERISEWRRDLAESYDVTIPDITVVDIQNIINSNGLSNRHMIRTSTNWTVENCVGQSDEPVVEIYLEASNMYD